MNQQLYSNFKMLYFLVSYPLYSFLVNFGLSQQSPWHKNNRHYVRLIVLLRDGSSSFTFFFVECIDYYRVTAISWRDAVINLTTRREIRPRKSRIYLGRLFTKSVSNGEHVTGGIFDTLNLYSLFSEVELVSQATF